MTIFCGGGNGQRLSVINYMGQVTEAQWETHPSAGPLLFGGFLVQGGVHKLCNQEDSIYRDIIYSTVVLGKLLSYFISLSFSAPLWK